MFPLHMAFRFLSCGSSLLCTGTRHWTWHSTVVKKTYEWWLALVFEKEMLGYQMLPPSVSHGCSSAVITTPNPPILATLTLLWSVWSQIRRDTCSVRKTWRCRPHISTHPSFCVCSLRKRDSTSRSVFCGRKHRVWGLYKNWGLQCSLMFEDVGFRTR